MSKYKKIKISEYKRYYGDVIVLASYPNNYIARICYDFAKRGVKMVIFNLRKSIRDEIQQRLEQEHISEEMLYRDEKENADISYIQQKSHELISLDDGDVGIVIDNDGIIDYTEDDVNKLHELSRKLHTAVIITAHLLDSAKKKIYPTLNDIGNDAIVQLADSIVVSNNIKSKYNLLIKNKHGKIGLLEFGGDENDEE